MITIAGPTNLACNYFTNPLGVSDPAPRLSWRLSPNRGHRGLAQSAYRILVSSTPNGPVDHWDSGRVKSNATTHIAYSGKALSSRQRAYWRVTSWDEKGTAVTSKETAFWETGLLARGDWKAQWIGAPWFGSGQSSAPAPFLRRGFSLRNKPAQARLYVTALGLYEAYLNGKRVGADIFTPGWTDYNKRVQYQVYDVTAMLAKDSNVLGAILGDGWYCGHIAQRGREVYGDRPRLLVQLEITHSDGSREVIATDNSWLVASGPILENDFLMGESYDARQELADWFADQPTDSRWRPAEIFPDPGIELSPILTGAVRAHESIKPVKAPAVFGGWKSSRYIYDFGQNLVGTVTLRVKAPAGTTVKIRYGEVLTAIGDLYVENLRTARATDYYTCKGDPKGEKWTPRFTFHGFRYAEISGLPKAPETGAIVAHVLHSDIPKTGEFTCSDPLVNQLQRNIDWGQRGNYLEVPTDCPQRDERLGWTGDAQVFIRTGAWNRSIAAFFTKWQRDITDAQRPTGAVPAVIPFIDLVPDDGGPAWADAAIICPWTIYQCYGDKALLASHFESMCRFVDFLGTQSRGGIRLHPDLKRWDGFGDWLALDGSGRTEGGTPKDLIGTAFYVHCARLLATISDLLDRPKEATRYRSVAKRAAQAFQRRYVTADGLVSGNTQTSYVLALHFDLVPVALRPRLVQNLVRDIEHRGDKLGTGFVGTPFLLHVLTQGGRLDVAYRLLHQTGWPSWLYPVTQGATTIWERWDGWTKEKGFQDIGMNSFNHYAYGAVGEWLYRTVAGIDIDSAVPGYQSIRLAPRPGGKLMAARGRLDSMHGRIVSDWRMTPGHFVWKVEIPPNTRATVRFPVPLSARIVEGRISLAKSRGVSGIACDGDAPTCALASGRYIFSAIWGIEK